MSGWRTNLDEFAIDLLTLVEDQVALAKTDPVTHQRATVAECGAAIACLKKRLSAAGEVDITQAMLTYGAIFTTHWQSDWDKLAIAPIAEFLDGLDKLLVGAQSLRWFFEEKGRREDKTPQAWEWTRKRATPLASAQPSRPSW